MVESGVCTRLVTVISLAITLQADSYFSIWIRPDGFSENNRLICVIFMVNQPRLAFRYDSDNVVRTRLFNNSNVAFQFELIPVDQPAVEFVEEKLM